MKYKSLFQADYFTKQKKKRKKFNSMLHDFILKVIAIDQISQTSITSRVSPCCTLLRTSLKRSNSAAVQGCDLTFSTIPSFVFWFWTPPSPCSQGCLQLSHSQKTPSPVLDRDPALHMSRLVSLQMGQEFVTDVFHEPPGSLMYCLCSLSRTQ